MIPLAVVNCSNLVDLLDFCFVFFYYVYLDVKIIRNTNSNEHNKQNMDRNGTQTEKTKI